MLQKLKEKRSESADFLSFVSRMKALARLILSGSLDGFWPGRAAFISEEKKDSLKVKKP